MLTLCRKCSLIGECLYRLTEENFLHGIFFAWKRGGGKGSGLSYPPLDRNHDVQCNDRILFQ